MTPAEQIRATMALLEAVAAPRDNATAVDQLFNMAIDVPELDEGAGVKSILATLVATVGMSLASGAASATGVEDARCAGALAALSQVDQARGKTDNANTANLIAHKLAGRAAQGGVVGDEFKKQANSAFTTIKQFVETGRENQAKDYAIQCINSLKSGGGAQSAAAKERAQDRANSQRQAQQTQPPGFNSAREDGYSAGRSAHGLGMNPNQGLQQAAQNYQNNPAIWQAFKDGYAKGYYEEKERYDAFVRQSQGR